MRSTHFVVTMFFFCILSAAEKITSSIKQGLRKMFITIIFCQARFTEFRTHQFKSFSNSKYLAIAFSINFKVAKYTSCFSALYMLWNVLIVKLAKLYTVNLCLSFSFVHAPVCANCNYSCNCIFFKKKKRKMTRTLVWVKLPKLCHNTLLSIFFLGKGRESLRLKTLHKN